MTSPVDTTVKFFTSDRPGTPVLNGTAGSLKAVLDACLVDGYGLKSVVSLIVASGVATLTVTGGHSFQKDGVVLIAGAAPAALNGEQKVTITGANTVAFATAVPDQTATGAITVKNAPLGWAKVFDGTNTAVYKSLAPEATGHLLRIDDTDPQRARVVGYEAMSDVDTGTGPFPTPAQQAGGGYWVKSVYANDTPVAWSVFGDARVFYVHIGVYSSVVSGSYPVGGLRGFGDMTPLRPSGDAYACALGYVSSGDLQSYAHQGTFDNATYDNLAFPRGYTGVGSGVLASSRPYSGNITGISGNDNYFGAFPSPVDGSLHLSPRFVNLQEGVTEARCDVPGVFTSPQTKVRTAYGSQSTVCGTGALTGRNLKSVIVAYAYTNSSPNDTGITFVDITGPWR